MSDNNREFTRVPVRVTVKLGDTGRDIVASHSRDLSLNGLFLVCEPGLELDAECQVLIQLGHDDAFTIRARAVVVRVDSDGVALRFLDLAGHDSLEHLQNLVRYNAGELDKVEAELSRHVGLNRRPA